MAFLSSKKDWLILHRRKSIFFIKKVRQIWSWFSFLFFLINIGIEIGLFLGQSIKRIYKQSKVSRLWINIGNRIKQSCRSNDLFYYLLRKFKFIRRWCRREKDGFCSVLYFMRKRLVLIGFSGIGKDLLMSRRDKLKLWCCLIEIDGFYPPSS